MTAPPTRILLLVNSDPRGSGIGELFLRDIAAGLPADQLIRYSTLSAKPPADCRWFGGRALARRVPWSRWPMLSSIAERVARSFSVPSIVREIDQIIREERIELVWAVLSSPTVIEIAAKIATEGGVPVVSTILDDPRYFMTAMHLSETLRRQTLESFAQALKASARVSVIGEAMKEDYRSAYGVESVILRHGLDESMVRPWSGRKSGDKFNLVFAGSLYAKKEWNSLLASLNQAGWELCGRKIEITFIGKFPRFGAHTSANVRNLGVMSMSETLEEAARADAAYLPYWFDARWERVSRTSFPGKLSAYAAAGVPVFFHAPRYSSGTEFLARYPFGTQCASRDSGAIRKALEFLITDPSMGQAAENARARAIYEELGGDVMRRRFMELIDGDSRER